MIDWLLQNKKKLNLCVIHYDWAKNIWPGLVDLSVEIQVSSSKFIGRGTATSEKLALLRAAGEALERAAFQFSIFENTNGLALHDSFENASSAAILELLERDSILCHHLLNLPFARLSNDLADEFDDLILAFNQQNKSNVIFSLGKSEGPNGAITCACAAHGLFQKNPFGVMLGAACSFSEKISATKAVIECMRNVIGAVSGSQHPSLSIEMFNKKTIYSPLDHDSIALNPKYFKNYAYLFEREQSIDQNQKTDFENLEFEIDSLELPPELIEMPAVVVRAHCASIQNLWFGPTSFDNVNFERLSVFASEALVLDKLNFFPHPMG